MNTADILALVTMIGFALSNAVLWSQNRSARRNLTECKAANEALLEMLDTRTAVANSCRLISITRDDRMNYFTFARGDKIFTVETMGMMSDDVAAWRRDAGITDIA